MNCSRWTLTHARPSAGSTRSCSRSFARSPTTRSPRRTARSDIWPLRGSSKALGPMSSRADSRATTSRLSSWLRTRTRPMHWRRRRASRCEVPQIGRHRSAHTSRRSSSSSRRSRWRPVRRTVSTCTPGRRSPPSTASIRQPSSGTRVGRLEAAREIGERPAIAAALANHARVVQAWLGLPERAIAIAEPAWTEFADLEQTPAGRVADGRTRDRSLRDQQPSRSP